MSYMYLKNRKKKNIKARIIILLIIIILIIYFLGINISKILLEYAKIELEKNVSILVNKAVKSDVLEKMNENNLYIITKGKNDEIEMIDYNPYIINYYMIEITNNIEKEITNINNKNIKIPIGVIFNNPILNTIGPNIKIKTRSVGYISTSVSMNVKEYGINNSVLELLLNVEIKEQLILPVLSKTITIKNKIPISYKIITGKIPDYYGTTITRDSNIYSIPIE